MKICLSLEELWFVQQLVCRTDHLGEPWDRDDMRKIHNGILAVSAQQQEAEHEVDVSEGFLWQMENQVPQTLDLGRSNIGRRILLKVFAALNLEVVCEEPIPGIFRDYDPGADDAGPNGHSGPEGGAWGDLPSTTKGVA